MRGYLVVLKKQDELYLSQYNPQYCGIDRMPTYPSPIPAESEASNAYAFGDFQNEASDLIEVKERAHDLLNLFSTSPRAFEIIYCATVDESEKQPDSFTFYGYDCAGSTAPFLSLVGDFPSEIEFKPFRSRFNKHGLFSFQDDAIEFFTLYRSMQLHDHDLPYSIWRVYGCS